MSERDFEWAHKRISELACSDSCYAPSTTEVRGVNWAKAEIDRLRAEAAKLPQTSAPIPVKGAVLNAEGLLSCPFCGGDPKKVFIGNDHTKTRKVEIRCRGCHATRVDAAMRNSHEWLDKVATEAWNLRVDPILCTFPSCDTARALDVAQRPGMMRAAEIAEGRYKLAPLVDEETCEAVAAAIRAEAQALRGEE